MGKAKYRSFICALFDNKTKKKMYGEKQENALFYIIEGYDKQNITLTLGKTQIDFG